MANLGYNIAYNHYAYNHYSSVFAFSLFVDLPWTAATLPVFFMPGRPKEPPNMLCCQFREHSRHFKFVFRAEISNTTHYDFHALFRTDAL